MASVADRTRVSEREFRGTHPWIAYTLDLSRTGWSFWSLLGEARSKCRHLAFSPLPPSVGEELSALYLAKGAHATTAIEGNTLSEEQALEAVQGQLRLPVSQEYLKREIENIIAACASIEQEILTAGGPFQITPERLMSLNRQVLEGLEVPDYVVPGEFREGSVVVGGVYRGAPAADCEFLVEALCEWLNGTDFEITPDPQEAFLHVFLRAVAAHLYIAWIHPFGDGNGRTARLVEFGILTAAGVPSVAAHLLSNHYNATRDVYYRQLEYASKSGGDLDRFLTYAAQGFVDGLQEQLNRVHAMVFEIAWRSYVDDAFGGEETAAPRRQRQLVLALGHDWVQRSALPTITPELAASYANKGAKTITRDINALLARGLIEREGGRVRARREVMLGFLPRVAQGALIF